MEAAAQRITFRPISSASARALATRAANGAVWLASFLLVLYLALKNGGFDVVERSEVGIAVWWIVVVGTVVGAFAPGGESRTGRILLVILALFAGWTALSLGWTESAGSTSIELGKITAYLGFFAFALAVQGAGRWRPLLFGVTAAIGTVTALAVLSRLEPSWFPQQVAARFTPSIRPRLLYPLNYSTGLAAFMAMGVPLLLNASASARTLGVRALAAAALPVAGLGLWLTGSSLALPLLLVGVLVYLALSGDRIPVLATVVAAAAGGAILVAAENQRGALDAGLHTTLAQSQGHGLLGITLLVCGGVAALQLGISLVARFAKRPGWLSPDRRTSIAITAVAGVIAIVIAVGAGAPGWISNRWDNFTSPSGGDGNTRQSQVLDLSSSGRYRMWQAAIDAFDAKPLTGIGPGTFQFWWARNGKLSAPVQDAHSLPLESLAELGIPGGLLISGFCLAILAVGAIRALRVPDRMRGHIAAATAGAAACVTALAVDWSWELGAVSAAFLLLAAVAVAGGGEPDPAVRRRHPGGLLAWMSVAGRVVVVLAGLACLVAIALPLATARDLQQSQAAAADGNLAQALKDARNATDVQPYAAAPLVQEALVLERQGQLQAAVEAARSAAGKEATNWQVWLILSRLEARTGNARAAVRDFRMAHSLAPRLSALAIPGAPS